MQGTTIKGYKRVNLRTARKAYDEGKMVVIYPSNVNDCHIFDGWHLGCEICNKGGDSFDAVLNSFLFYMDKELGTYAKFLVEVQ